MPFLGFLPKFLTVYKHFWAHRHIFQCIFQSFYICILYIQWLHIIPWLAWPLENIGVIEALWRIYGGFMRELWRIYGGFMEDLWLIYGGCMVDLWRIYGGFMEDLWKIYGGFVKDLWRIYGGFMDKFSEFWFLNLEWRQTRLKTNEKKTWIPKKNNRNTKENQWTKKMITKIQQINNYLD